VKRGCRNIGVFLAALASPLAVAQEDVCKPGEGIDQTQMMDLITRRSTEGRAVLNEVINETPRSTPADRQLSVPAALAAFSPDIVSSPDFTSLLALAVDAGLISQSSGATTLNLNFFSVIAAMNSRVLEEQEQYERFTDLRRFSGSITFGGKGEAIDQDGDGVVDDPKTAEKSTDIVTWEVRYRLFGSRDRRDRKNYQKFFKPDSKLVRLDDAQVKELTKLVAAYRAKHPTQAIAKFFCRPDVEAFIADPANRATVDGFIKRDTFQRAAFEAIAEEIDNSLLITAAVGGTERRDEAFGPDRRSYGLRASWARKGRAFDANLDFNEIKSFRGAEDQESTRFGLSYNEIFLKDLVGYELQGISVKLSAAYEKYRNVPNTVHDKIESLNLKVTYPVSAAINLPFSITYANHADLLTGEKEIRGNIGFTYDLSPLRQPTQ